MAAAPLSPRIEDRIKGLPLMDTAAYKLLTLLNDPESDYQQVVDSLSPDVAARFLNMANKACYGRVVRSIHQAVALLGYNNMRKILVTSFLLDHFTRRMEMKNFSFEKFQQQSHFCATVSRALAAVMDYRKQEDLFTVATLYNIGKLIIAVYFEAEHAKIIAAKQAKISTSMAEQKILGVTHADIGAMTLQRFKIPQDICNAVRYHNQKAGIIGAESDFKLELIARQAAAIVHQFCLPDEAKLESIEALLQEAVSKGERTRPMDLAVESSLEAGRQAFIIGLDQAGQLIVHQLEGSLAMRTDDTGDR